ncbi:cation diffusion facilitator family transporter [Tundrisphaera sp. TA3]|uniref:cation diffusion facilitator family transporter n=1 Tax=Tundrisphaera sp. TA3 TaxID=3435775 RepID=UPI003EC04632
MMTEARTTPPGVRSPNLSLYREARKAAIWGVAISLGLGVAKLIGGWYGNSLGLISDAAHSLVDAVISGALFGALWIAQRPADHEHPYGHARFEAVAGSGVALILIGLAAGIAYEAYHGLGRPRGIPEAYTLAIAIGGIAFQEGLYRYARSVALRTGSGALLATAWDYRLDALGSVAVVAGVGLSRWGGPDWAWADHAAALMVAGAISWVGGSLLWGNIQDLMDRQATPAVLSNVRDEAMAARGVLGVEKLRVRKVGLEYLVDIHVEVDPEQTVRAGHEIAHAVKDRVIERVPSIRDVLVHIEPAEDQDAVGPFIASPPASSASSGDTPHRPDR